MTDGQTIYEGTNVAISIWGLHRNEEYWENPLKFNPYRFMMDEYQQGNPFRYIHFFAGPRNCVGQKLAFQKVRICLYYILKNFDFTSVQAEDKLEICTNMVTLLQNNILIKFES